MGNFEPLWRVKAAQEGRLRTTRPRAKMSPGTMATREQAAEAWGHIANALAASGTPGDRTLSQAIKRFVSEMPGAQSQRGEVGLDRHPKQTTSIEQEYQK